MIQDPAENRSSKMPQGTDQATRIPAGNEIIAFDTPPFGIPEPEMQQGMRKMGQAGESAYIVEPITEDLSKVLIEPVDELSYRQRRREQNGLVRKEERGEKSPAGQVKKHPRLTSPRLVTPPAAPVSRRIRVTRKLINIAGSLEQPEQFYPSPLPAYPPPQSVETSPGGHLPGGRLSPCGPPNAEEGTPVSTTYGGPRIGMNPFNSAQAQQESERLAQVSLPAPARFHQVPQAFTSLSPSPRLSPHSRGGRVWEHRNQDGLIWLLVGLMALGILSGTVSGYLLTIIN